MAINWADTKGCFIDVQTKLPGASADTNVGGDVATIKCLEALFANVVFGLFMASGIAVFIMLLVGGFNFLFSGGDQKKVEQAQKTITNAVIGIVIIAAAYLILRTIGVFTGVTVTFFQVSTTGPTGQQFIRTH